MTVVTAPLAPTPTRGSVSWIEQKEPRYPDIAIAIVRARLERFRCNLKLLQMGSAPYRIVRPEDMKYLRGWDGRCFDSAESVRLFVLGAIGKDLQALGYQLSEAYSDVHESPYFVLLRIEEA